MERISFDEVFQIWLNNEIDQIEGRDLLPVAQSKGFTSIAEWRFATALRLGMDTKEWSYEIIEHPNAVLPKVIIGPYQGWSQFFDNQFRTSFAQALEIPEFFAWCQNHDRIIPIANTFPLPTTLILFRKPNGEFIQIEGGHRICAVAYRKKIGQPIDFAGKPPVMAAIADIGDREIPRLAEFLRHGTLKQQKTL